MSLPNASSGHPRAQIESLIGARRYPEALRLITSLEAEYPGNRDLLYARAYCLAAMGNMEDARQAAQTLGVIYGDPRGAQILARIPSMQTARQAPSPTRTGSPGRLVKVAAAAIAIVVLTAVGMLALRPAPDSSAAVETPVEASPEDIEAAKSTVDAWAAALRKRDLPAVMATIGEDFRSTEYGDKSSLQNFLASAFANVSFVVIAFDWSQNDGAGTSNVSTEYVPDGAGAIVASPIHFMADGIGTAILKMTLAERGGVYQIVGLESV